jgi:hypothetical protein
MDLNVSKTSILPTGTYHPSDSALNLATVMSLSVSLTSESFYSESFIGIGVTIGTTEAFVRNFVTKTCRTIIDFFSQERQDYRLVMLVRTGCSVVMCRGRCKTTC